MNCLREATIDDCELVFRWRNLPFIVELSTTQREVGWDEHISWFRTMLSSTKTIMYIIEIENKPAGQVRLDYVNLECAEISIYLLSQYTGRGFGVAAIRSSCKQQFERDVCLKSIVAFIRNGNTSSFKAFQKVGFRTGIFLIQKSNHSSLLLTREEFLSEGLNGHLNW